ncbi:MAG: hypothetical protein ABW101_14260, partial [Candidatus Thiodiazotropha sp.]
ETDIVLAFPMRSYGIYNSGILTNDLDGPGPLEPCSGTLNDGISDGETLTLENLSAPVNDYPHGVYGGYCANAGYAASEISDVVLDLNYYGYEETAVAYPDDCSRDLCDIMPRVYPFLKRAVNVIAATRRHGGNRSVLGTPAANVFDWILDAGFEAGWLTVSAVGYDYETNPSIVAMTEITGGIGADSAGIWTGVPVIGFSVMAADVGPSQAGELVELIRHVNRN